MTNKIVFVFFNLSAPIFGLKILSKQIFSILTGCFGNILYFPGNFSYFALPLGRTGLPMVVRNWRAVPIRALQEKTWLREGTEYIVKIGNFLENRVLKRLVSDHRQAGRRNSSCSWPWPCQGIG